MSQGHGHTVVNVVLEMFDTRPAKFTPFTLYRSKCYKQIYTLWTDVPTATLTDRMINRPHFWKPTNRNQLKCLLSNLINLQRASVDLTATNHSIL